MQDHAYLVELVAGFLYLPAAALLLRLAARTGKLPERLLGLGFACTGGSYLLYEAAYPLGLEAQELALVVAARLTYGAGCVAIAVFTRVVFRSREPWAGIAVWFCAALVLSGFALSCATGDIEGTALDSPGFWIEWVGQMLPALWLTGEGFVSHRRARRRLRLGLSDPHVCNRFLLWSLFGIFQLLAGFAVLWMYSVLAVEGRITAAMDLTLGGAELASLAMIWLAFAAPAWYRRWIEQLAPALADSSASPSGRGA